MNFGEKYCSEHPDQLVMGICMEPQCNQNSRLMCFSCTTGEHFEHGKMAIRISDLNKDLLEIKGFPKDDTAVDLKRLIVQSQVFSQNGLEMVDKLFDEQSQIIFDELERAKTEVKRRLEKSMENKSNTDLEKLRNILYETYDLSTVQMAYSKLISEEISMVEFNIAVAQYLKLVTSEKAGDALQSAIEEQNQKETQIQLDIDGFKQAIQEISLKIREIPQLIILECNSTGGFQIEPAPQFANKGNTGVQIIKPGKEITLITSYSALITPMLDKGRYEFEIETVSNISSCCLFGLVPEEQKDNTNGVYSSHPYHCFSNSCGAMNTGGNCESQYQTGGIMVVVVDFRKDQYSYGWKHSKNRSTMTGYSIKGKKMRWYINAYSVTNLTFRLLKAKKN